MSYDSYLDLQRKSCRTARRYFGICWSDGNSDAWFCGQVDQVMDDYLLFERIGIRWTWHDGTICAGAEDQVCMEKTGFPEDMKAGDKFSFTADIYRYVNDSENIIDFGLRNQQNIIKEEAACIPTDEDLVDEQIHNLICEICMYRDHCDGFCIANQDELKERFDFLKSVEPGHFTPITVAAAYEIEGHIFETMGGIQIPEGDANAEAMGRIISYVNSHPSGCEWPIEDALASMMYPDKPRVYM